MEPFVRETLEAALHRQRMNVEMYEDDVAEATARLSEARQSLEKAHRAVAELESTLGGTDIAERSALATL